VANPSSGSSTTVPDESRLADDLLQAEAYGALQPESIEMRSTHISRVYLADGEVFKLRRPVKLPFVDYSSLSLRRDCAAEELRLGRRLAPAVYRGLVPVCWDGRRHTLHGQGEIVDWALQMQRLSDTDTAEALLHTDALSASHLERLALMLSGFYLSEASKPQTAPGDFATVLRLNLSELRAQRPEWDAPLDAIAGFCEAALARQEAILHERQERHVRDGHGDLRLEHVYFLGPGQAEIIALDPIEFDARLRVVDVALDAAFFAMELYAAGKAALAEVFTARLARALGDFGFYPVLALYLCHRALVRCKVAALVAAEPTPSAQRRADKLAESERLLSLAHAFARPAPRKPWLLCVAGLPGSGKTTLAESIGLVTEAPVVSSDWLRKRWAGVPLYERGEPSLYSDASNRRTLSALLQSAGSVLDSGRPVILDATFTRQDWRRAAFDFAAARGVDALFIEAVCPEEVLRQRLRARETESSVSDARESLLDAFLTSREPATELPTIRRHEVKTTLTPEEACRQALQFLSHHGLWPNLSTPFARTS